MMSEPRWPPDDRLTTLAGAPASSGLAMYDTGDYAAPLDKVLEAAGYDELRAQQAKRRASNDVAGHGWLLGHYRDG